MTESYGSQKDPDDNNEIPHCTLKMFPEETLHCVEWARDLFGALFSQAPKSALKTLEEGENVNPTSQQDVVALKEGLGLLVDRPKTFDDCVKYNNNDEAEKGGCSQGAVDGVVKTNKTKGSVISKEALYYEVAKKTGKSIEEVKTIIENSSNEE